MNDKKYPRHSKNLTVQPRPVIANRTHPLHKSPAEKKDRKKNKIQKSLFKAHKWLFLGKILIFIN